jgi:hypothetical protein
MRDICRNASSWPGANGSLSDDDFRVVGRLDRDWSYTGVLKYPTRDVLRLKPGEMIKAKVDLFQYYRSDRQGDEIISVEWSSGFVYCDYKR